MIFYKAYNASFFSDYQRFGTCPGYVKTVEMMEESIRLTLVTPLYKRENVRFYTEKCGLQIVSTEKDGNIELARFLMER